MLSSPMNLHLAKLNKINFRNVELHEFERGKSRLKKSLVFGRGAGRGGIQFRRYQTTQDILYVGKENPFILSSTLSFL